MASIISTRDHLHIALGTGEKWAALHWSDLLIPWSDVDGVQEVAEPFRLVRGLRAPGLALPWRTKIGTWRQHGRKIFAVTSSGVAGVRILLHGNEFEEILLSRPDPAATAELIRAGKTAAATAAR